MRYIIGLAIAVAMIIVSLIAIPFVYDWAHGLFVRPELGAKDARAEWCSMWVAFGFLIAMVSVAGTMATKCGTALAKEKTP